MRRVEIFDTTLRDGEQSPGISLSVEEKVEIARQLARLKVDVIEGGLPHYQRGGLRVRLPHSLGGQGTEDHRPRPHPRGGHRAGLGGRAMVTEAAHPHLRGNKRPAHRAPDALEPERTSWGGRGGPCAWPKGLCENVEFSPMDATRTDIVYLRGRRRGCRGRGRRDQHRRHRRLHDTGRVHGLPRGTTGAGTRARGSHPLGPATTIWGGRRQLARRGRDRGRPGRGRRQRHRGEGPNASWRRS